MNEDRTHRQITLKDGRALGYAEYGAPEGVPVFYFHGFPSSRLDYTLIDWGDVALGAHVRIIAPDRPGYGLSDFQRGRRFLDWPDDVIELADALGIDRFAVLGCSGGGPYAAACAYKLDGRLTKAGILCGMGPADSPGMKDGVSWSLPGMFSPMRSLMLSLTVMGLSRDPDKFLSRSRETMAELDGTLLDQPEAAKAFVAGMLEAFRSGTKGANQEATIYTRPWGFQPQGIKAEVHLWHGEQDLNVPVSVGRYLADAIPNCNARFYEEEGHLTLPRNRIRDILRVLVD